MERERWAELSAAISDVARSTTRNARQTHDISLIIRVYLWSVLHDRPVVWACDPRNWWPRTRPHKLPSQSTMSRRMRTEAFDRFMNALTSRLRGSESADLVKRIDGKAMAVARHSSDPDATSGRGVGGMQRGYKLHAVWGSRPMPEVFEVLPLNHDERTVAKRLIPRLEGGGYLLGDNNFDTNDLFDFTAEYNHRLLAPRRPSYRFRTLAHTYQSPHRKRCIEMLEPGPGRPCRFGRALAADRRQIERDFGNATSFGGGLTLPPFVRRAHRVRHWVHAKLLINAARIRCNRRQQPEAIAA